MINNNCNKSNRNKNNNINNKKIYYKIKIK